jgi:hypothetical protein
MMKYRECGWNRARFEAARSALIAAGHEVCSPLMVDDGFGGPDATAKHFPLAFLLALDTQVISTCEAIVSVEPGWGDSRGSRVEAFAALTFGIPILSWPTMLPIQRDALAQAVLRVFDGPPRHLRPVLALIGEERRAQDLKWGEQNHKDGTGLPGDSEKAEKAKQFCDDAFRAEIGSWRLILEEEVLEAFAEPDETDLILELIQVAAVATAWVESIRRRKEAKA